MPDAACGSSPGLQPVLKLTVRGRLIATGNANCCRVPFASMVNDANGTPLFEPEEVIDDEFIADRDCNDVRDEFGSSKRGEEGGSKFDLETTLFSGTTG